ncbi:MAG: hypothetical protein ACRD7E_12135 [Bryobacteraceae bacterium]
MTCKRQFACRSTYSDLFVGEAFGAGVSTRLVEQLTIYASKASPPTIDWFDHLRALILI